MAHRDSTSSVAAIGVNNLTVDAPAGLAENDEIFLAWSNAGNDASTITWPSGFTELVNASQAAPDTTTHRVARKRATASEPGTYNVSSSTTDYCTLICVAHSGRVDEVPAYQLTNYTTADASVITVALTGITAVAADDIVVFVAASLSGGTPGTWAPATDYTEREEALAVFYASATCWTRDNVSAGATGTLSGTLTGSSNAGYSGVVIRLAASGGGSSITTILDNQRRYRL